MEIVLFFGGLIVLIIVILLYGAIASTTHLVSQDERLVIYRLGSFSRLAGPGAVQTIAGLDEVVSTINIGDLPVEVTIPDCSVFGLSADLTLKFWCRFDPLTTAKDRRHNIAALVRISDTERRQLIELKTREAVVRQISHLQERMPLPDKATREDRLAALAPGSLRHNALLQAVKNDLEQALFVLGIILTGTQQPALLIGGVETEQVAATPGKDDRITSGVDKQVDDQTPPAEKAQSPYRLTKRDLAVLKRVPREDTSKRLTA